MPVDIMLYRQAVGFFVGKLHHQSFCKFQSYTYFAKSQCLYNSSVHIFLIFLVLLCCGDVHPNPGPLSGNDLKIIHLNVRSLKDKIDIIEAEFMSYDVICITETWLNNYITDNQISIPNFHLPFRKDRQSRGGGVAIYVKSRLSVKYMDMLDIVGLEAIWVQVTCKTRKHLIGTFYRADKSEAYWELIDESIGNAVDLNMFIVIAGDFNIDILRENKQKIEYLQAFYGIKQIITEATRITPNSSTLIDLIFVSCAGDVRNSGVLDPVCSDHCPIFVHIKEIIAQNNNYLRKIYNYSLADKDSINSGIARIDCNSLFNSDNVDTISVLLTNNIKDICDKHIPNKTVLIRPRDPLWMTNEIRHLMRKRHRQHKIAKRQNRPITSGM